MDRVDKLIDIHKEKHGKLEPIIVGKLQMINGLYAECEKSDEAIYFNEIINNFSDIIQLQKELIEELREKAEYTNNIYYKGASFDGEANKETFMTTPSGAFTTDEEMQAAFTYYLACKAEKKLSSYTINDYCSRIKKLWKSFCEAYIANELPDEFQEGIEITSSENPFLNVSKYIEPLNYYIAMKSSVTNEKRNWANIQAALNKFEEFIDN